MEEMVFSGLVMADETLAGLGEADDGRCGARAFGVGDDDGFAAFHNGNTAVGGAKVDANDLAHSIKLPSKLL